MTQRRYVPYALAALALALLAACVDATTSTHASDVQNMKARWDARPATAYHYDFAEGGFFIYCPNPDASGSYMVSALQVDAVAIRAP